MKHYKNMSFGLYPLSNDDECHFKTSFPSEESGVNVLCPTQIYKAIQTQPKQTKKRKVRENIQGT